MSVHVILSLASFFGDDWFGYTLPEQEDHRNSDNIQFFSFFALFHFAGV
jgi:hypothetical protein